MTQVFQEDDNVTPVTVVEAGPCYITQVLSEEKSGTKAVQIGFDEIKKASKPKTGHLKDLPKLRYLKQFKLEDDKEWKRGDRITAEVFAVGDKVKVTGVSKGKGFQGVVKRYKFRGGPASHGHKDNLRAPGSIGATEPARVFKGTRMAGRMGGKQATTRNLEIIKVDTDKNQIYIKGSVPGARNTLLVVQSLFDKDK